MQNFPHQQTPPGGAPSGGMYNAMPPAPQKSGLSKGCLIGIVAAVLFVIIGVVLLSVLGGSMYWFSRQAATNANSRNGNTSSSNSAGNSSSSSSSSNSAAETPSPTSAQSAAVAGGQSARWEQQEISWTVPQRWIKQSADSRMFYWRSPGTADAAAVIANVSPMSADFPVETSINAMYQGAQTQKQNGEVAEVRWLTLDGVKGILTREHPPEDSSGSMAFRWMGYRTYKGQTQLVTITFTSLGKDFARHEDALYGILYTTKFSQ